MNQRINQVPSLKTEKEVYFSCSKSKKGKESWLVRPQQKGINMVKDVVNKVSRAGELVMEMTARTICDWKGVLDVLETLAVSRVRDSCERL